jgi:hypothetical protein
MFGRILIAGWLLFCVLILILVGLRNHLGKIPHIYLLKPFLFLLILASFLYSILCLYRQGMKRAKGK